MRIFIYEHMTAQSIGIAANSPDHGMYLEGRAMRDAVVADALRIAGASVLVWSDDQAPISIAEFEKLSQCSDWTFVIAPEIDGCLFDLAAKVEATGGRLLGPSSQAIRLTSDKLVLAEFWRAHGIATPATTDRSPTNCEAFPVVWKPRDGAGSNHTFLLNSAIDVVRTQAVVAGCHPIGQMILQEFVPGTPASIAFICGPHGNIPLLPAYQYFSSDGCIRYLGGELPLPPHLAARAREIGTRALESITGLKGYVGVDLVLGSEIDASGDFAIEVNPRLTTSYVGLRTLAAFNLVEAMVATATTGLESPLPWNPGIIRFRGDGIIQI